MTPADIEEIFLSTINEGKLYDARLRQAFNDRFEHNTLDASSGALMWVTLAGQAFNTYARSWGDFHRTVQGRLTLALKLADYYEAHISEFPPEERIATAKRLGLPGLKVNP